MLVAFVIASALETLALIGLGALFYDLSRMEQLSRTDERRHWVEERRELLNRIQRPQVVPLAPVTGFAQPEPEPDQIELVGTITYEPEGEE